MTIYLDMDGVIADFFGSIATRNNVSHWKSIKEMHKALVDIHNTDFFYKINCFRGYELQNNSEKIVKFVKLASNNDWGICSTPLKDDEYNSAYWKRKWLEEYDFMPEDLEKLIFTDQKHKYAVNRLTGKPNILIDDKITNIKKWNECGGIGIRFQGNKDDIEEYLFEEIKTALEKI